MRLQADSTKQADNNTYPPEAENEAAGARMRALYGLLLRINTATTTSGVAGRGATNGHSLDPADPPTHLRKNKNSFSTALSTPLKQQRSEGRRAERRREWDRTEEKGGRSIGCGLSIVDTEHSPLALPLFPPSDAADTIANDHKKGEEKRQWGRGSQQQVQ